MTATPTAPATAPEYTAEATARLDRYLVEVRDALRGVPGVSADEVEADIRDHVATALLPAAAPVALDRLEPVLEALGPPAGWRPAGAAAAGGFDWRAALAAFRRRLATAGGVLYRGPEDWRLAYLCLLFTALAVPTFGVCLVIAYLLGRAAIEVAHERGQSLGARRWLVYPAVVAVSLPALLAVLVLPLAVAPIVLNSAVLPAETYRDVVKSVDADGTVHFRAGVTPARTYPFARAGIDSSGSAPKRLETWHISDWDRAAHERTLSVMDALPVPRPLAGAALTAFAVVGGLLAWWLALGVTRRAFPHTAATVFHPLLSPETRGLPLGLIAYGLALAAWLGAARALLGA